MDNVTHSLFALTLARTRLNKDTTRGAIALVLASNAPDIDILATAGGARNYLEWHRGYTHGPLGMVALGVMSAAIAWIVGRRWSNGSNDARSFLRLTLLSMAGVVLHVLMDLPTSYGTRLLAPFDWHWFTTDWMPIVDIYLLVALAAGLYFGNRTPAARQRNVALVLVLMAANYGVRGVMHHRALVLAPRLFGPTLPQPCVNATSTRSPIDRWPRSVEPEIPMEPTRCLIEIAAMPSFINPFTWRVIAQMSNAYELQDVNVLDPKFLASPGDQEAFWRRMSRYPNRWTTAALAAAETHTGRTFLGFSRFPIARTIETQEGVTTVRLTDIRFVGDVLRPGPINGRRRASDETPIGFFTATIRIDPSGRITEEHLGD